MLSPLLLVADAFAQLGCDKHGTGSCFYDGMTSNCCLGVGCAAASQCDSGYAAPFVSAPFGTVDLSVCVQSEGDLGLAGYTCYANSQCQSGLCSRDQGCVGGTGYLQVGDYCTTFSGRGNQSPISQSAANSQCASNICDVAAAVCVSSPPTTSPTFPPPMCHGFVPGTTQSTSMGYMFAFFSVFFFGTNFIPVKQYETGDGMFFQLVLCVGIWSVGLIVNLVRLSHGNVPAFEPFAMWGGVLWATGNVMTVPIIRTIGLGMGMLIWGATNMLIGWATGSFGLFGLTKDTGITHSLNYGGVVCVLISLCLFMGVESKVGDDDEEDGDDPTEDKLTDELLRDHSGDGADEEGGYGELGNSGDNKQKSWIDDLTPAQRRTVGIPMAMVAGLLFGSCFNPPTYIMDHNKEGQAYGKGTAGHPDTGASGAGLDYVFSQFCGIFITSVFWMLVYCCVMKNKPMVYPEVILPGFVSGVMWAIAQFSWFVANECLSFSIAFPLITGGPGLLASLIGIYYGEISGSRNFMFLGASFVFLFVADGLIAASHPS